MAISARFVPAGNTRNGPRSAFSRSSRHAAHGQLRLKSASANREICPSAQRMRNSRARSNSISTGRVDGSPELSSDMAASLRNTNQQLGIRRRPASAWPHISKLSDQTSQSKHFFPGAAHRHRRRTRRIADLIIDSIQSNLPKTLNALPVFSKPAPRRLRTFKRSSSRPRFRVRPNGPSPHAWFWAALRCSPPRHDRS